MRFIVMFVTAVCVLILRQISLRKPGGGGTPYNGLYGEAPPGKGTFFRPQIYERVGHVRISKKEVYKRVMGNRSFRY